MKYAINCYMNIERQLRKNRNEELKCMKSSWIELIFKIYKNQFALWCYYY